MRPLLPPELARLLERLRLGARAPVHSMYKGESKSAVRGTSVEFSDYREYEPGDDYRYVDWNIYARLNRLFLKVFAEEQNLGITLLLDTSASMTKGSPPKAEYARRLVAALGYLALRQGDEARFGAAAAELTWKTPWRRGRHHVKHFFEGVTGVEFAGPTDLGQALKGLGEATARGRITLLVSDLLHPEWEKALAALAGRREDAVLIHLLAPEDWRPSTSGEFELIDAETGERLAISLDPEALAAYSRSAGRWIEEVRARCRTLGIDCYSLDTAYPLEQLLTGPLREGGLIR